MTRLLAVDPGPTQSALLGYDTKNREILFSTIRPNAEALGVLQFKQGLCDHLIIESLACYGMPVGAEVFETAYAIGDFRTSWRGDVTLMPRTTVKAHLCNSSKAKDANVRQALIDRFGPGKELAIGKKSAPGPLFGIVSHSWSALALAVTYSETEGAT